jgi:hypothetical protein
MSCTANPLYIVVDNKYSGASGRKVEELGIVVVGRLASGVADPPGGLEGDAVGSVK